MRSVWVCVLLGAALLCGPACAQAAEDGGHTGSIAVTLQLDGEPVAGGTLTASLVASAEDDGFVLTPDFEASGVALDDVQSPDVAAALDAYADAAELAGETLDVPADGTVRFEDLECGLYLVSQHEAAPGYQELDAFLVAIPLDVGTGAQLYDVQASPKVEPLSGEGGEAGGSSDAAASDDTADAPNTAADVVSGQPDTTAKQAGASTVPAGEAVAKTADASGTPLAAALAGTGALALAAALLARRALGDCADGTDAH